MKKLLLIATLSVAIIFVGATSIYSASKNPENNSTGQNMKNAEYNQSTVDDTVEYVLFTEGDNEIDENQISKDSLEERLETTISSLDKVMSAMVNINDETSSIIVDLKMNADEKLTEEEILGLTELVNASIEDSSEYDIDLNIEQ